VRRNELKRTIGLRFDPLAADIKVLQHMLAIDQPRLGLRLSVFPLRLRFLVDFTVYRHYAFSSLVETADANADFVTLDPRLDDAPRDGAINLAEGRRRYREVRALTPTAFLSQGVALMVLSRL
jgi:hypothetical protein